MIFKKEFLREFEGEEIENKIIDTTRWSIVKRRIFKHEGKFYETIYSFGATECQDESPYEYDKDEIECPEVVPVEKTIIVYEPIK